MWLEIADLFGAWICNNKIIPCENRTVKLKDKMKVEILTLCDFASADAAGKLNIIGVFDTINAYQVPIVFGPCALAARIRFNRIEEGLKRIKISFVDADGRAILPAMETQVPIKMTGDGSSATAQVVSIMSLLKLPSFGEYSIDLAVDGRQEGTAPLYTRQIQVVPPGQQPQAPPA